VKGKPEEYAGALHRIVAGKGHGAPPRERHALPALGGRRTTGTTLSTYDVGTGVKGAVFQGRRLAVLKATALDVYDTGTGARTHSYRLGKTARRLVDVQSGIGVIVSGGAVRLIQLDTGKGTTFAPHGGGTIQAQLEPTGLFISSAKELAFVPMASVLARFS
jgi:hypothetical protein